MGENLTCLSHWFPKIEAAGLPVPKTIIVPMPREALSDIFNVFDGNPMEGKADGTFDAIRAAADEIGYPAFLRTGLTSGKHEWKNTCYLASPDDVKGHVIQLVEYSELVDMMGLPCNIWVVREMLPTKPVGTCPSFRDMPLCREFRFFVDGPEIKCWHPYWPMEALEQGGAALNFDYEAFCRLSAAEEKALSEIASAAGVAVGGAWSVDLLETERGWFLTDMAVAHQSFHWEGCLLGSSP